MEVKCYMDKKILVTKSFMPPLEEYVDEIRELWDTHIMTNMGVKHKELQKQLKEYLKVENIELMVNGHLALELSIQAMGLTGEVITTPFTFASTTHAIARNGLKPVFCDIDPDTYTMDVTKIEELITDKTSAIIPVHVYGNICDVEKIEEIAKKYNLKVIYDAAHAFGETYKGKGIGSFGDASMFSFHATKVFNSIEGGAVCYKNDDYGVDLYRLKNFGIRGPEQVDYVGSNAKMNEFQASMGLCNLRYIEDEIARRKVIYDRYVSRLEKIPGVKVMHEQENVKHNYAYFPVVFDENICGFSRDRVFEELEKKNIVCRKYFYPLTNSYECYKDKYDVNDTPVALKISTQVLTLPMYGDLEYEVIDEICDTIEELYNK